MRRKGRIVALFIVLAVVIAGIRTFVVYRQEQSAALLAAITRGDTAAADAALSHGANPETRSPTGRTCLMLAATRGQAAMVKTLLAHGADTSAKDGDGLTALMWGAFSGRMEVVQMLLAKGSDAAAKDKFGGTALSWGKDHPDIAALLKQAGAKE